MSAFEKNSFNIDYPDTITRDELGPQNIRSILRSGRGVLKHAVSQKISELDNRTPDKNVKLFRTYADDRSEINCLILNDPDITGEDNTIIVTNIIRNAYPHEEHFPSGSTIFTFDLALPNPGTGRRRWLNSSSDEMIIYPDDESIDMPIRATFLRIGYSAIKLYGNLADVDNKYFEPLPARNIYDIEQDGEILFQTYNALSHISSNDLEQYITKVKT